MKNSDIPIHFELQCLGFTNDRDMDRQRHIHDKANQIWDMDPGTYFNYFNMRKL